MGPRTSELTAFLVKSLGVFGKKPAISGCDLKEIPFCINLFKDNTFDILLLDDNFEKINSLSRYHILRVMSPCALLIGYSKSVLDDFLLPQELKIQDGIPGAYKRDNP